MLRLVMMDQTPFLRCFLIFLRNLWKSSLLSKVLYNGFLYAFLAGNFLLFSQISHVRFLWVFGDFWFSVDFMTFFMNFSYFFFFSFFSFFWFWRFSIYLTFKSTSWNTKYLCYRSYRNIFDFSIIFYIFFNSFIEDNY